MDYALLLSSFPWEKKGKGGLELKDPKRNMKEKRE